MKRPNTTPFRLILLLAAAASTAAAAEPPPVRGRDAAHAAFCVAVQLAETGRHVVAFRWLTAAQKGDPKSAEIHVWLGTLCDEQLSRPDEAKNHFKRAMQLAPKSFRARYGYARHLLRKGELDEARRHILIAVDQPDAKANPGLVAQAYYQLALRLELRGDRDQAIQYYRKSVEVSANPALALLRLGRVYRDIGKYPESLVSFRQLARHVPSYARVYRELCDSYKAMGEWEQALRALQTYIAHRNGPGEQNHLLAEAADIAVRARMLTTARKLREKRLLNLLKRYSPEKATPHLCEEIARVLDRLGRTEQAVPYLKKAIAAAAADRKPLLRRKLAKLYERAGQVDAAVRELRSVIDGLEPKGSIPYRAELCAVLETAKRYEEARKALAAILDIPGAKAAGHGQLGLFYNRRGDRQKATRHLRDAIKFADVRQRVEHMISLSTVYGEGRLDKEAEQVLVEAQKLYPGNARVKNALSWFYAERNMKLKEALALVGAALKASPDNPAYIDTLGWVYFRQGRNREALEQLLRASSLAEDSVICDHLGDVYMKLGRPEKASVQWKRSLQLDPSIKGVREKLQKVDQPK